MVPYQKISSGVTLTNVETQSPPPPQEMTEQVVNMSFEYDVTDVVEMPIRYVAYDTQTYQWFAGT